jgi:D-cysteine desulfhydrase
VGALGYLECAVELTGQMSHGAPRFDAVVAPAGTGGSLAGLHMGKQLVGLPSEVVGVPVGRPGEWVREQVALTVDRAIRRFGFAIDVPKRIGLLEAAEGGLSPNSEAALQTVVDVAAEEGLVLDPVYTAPAFGALLDVLTADPRALGHRVCFVHTGGLFGVFPLRDRLAALAGARRP